MSGTKLTQTGEKLWELDKLMEKIDAQEDVKKDVKDIKEEKKEISHEHKDHKHHDHEDEEHNNKALWFVDTKETKRGLWNRLFWKKDSVVIETENTSATGELAVVKENEEDIHISKDEEMKLSNEKRGLFSRIFSKKENSPKDTDTHSETKDTEEETNTDINTEKTKQTVQASSENTSSKNDLIIKKPSSKTVTSNSQNVNLVKNTKNATAHSTVKNTYQLPSNFIFPGKNLTTKVGKSYEIGVKSLKLNNKSFTRNLGYMMKGDRVKQLAPANARGCFLAEITKATISANKGKKGYVCKKWLSEAKSKDVTVSEPADTNTTPSVQHGLKIDSSLLKGYMGTKVGDQVKVSQTYITDKKVVLEAKNTLEQVTEKDVNGCMKFLITKSNILNIAGKAITICQ